MWNEFEILTGKENSRQKQCGGDSGLVLGFILKIILRCCTKGQEGRIEGE